MRSAPLIAAGIALAVAGRALAASPPTSNMPATDAPMQSTQPATPTPPATTPGGTPSPTGSASDTSATAGAAAPALSVGEPVKDNTGATIGAISSLSTAANGQQMAVIKMGTDTFQVSSDKLGVTSGAATINLSQAQITGMLHPPAGGR
jgi:hypothetical protein